MEIETRTEDRILHLRVSGTVDGNTGAELRQKIVSGVVSLDGVVADLSDVTWVNSSGLGHLVAAYVSLLLINARSLPLAAMHMLDVAWTLNQWVNVLSLFLMFRWNRGKYLRVCGTCHREVLEKLRE